MSAVAVVLLIGDLQAVAASPAVESYIAARDHYITVERERAKAHDDRFHQVLKESGYQAAQKLCTNSACEDAIILQQPAWLETLHNKIIGIVSPPLLHGFPRRGEFNIGTLYPEIGFGMLDGLSYVSTDKRVTLVETTEELLIRWMRSQNSEHADEDKIPRDIIEALRSDTFYSFAITTDARFYRFAEIPVRAPTGATFAFAMLDLRTSDYAGSGPPTQITASVLINGRVFILSTEVKGVAPIPQCDAIWKQASSENQTETVVAEGDKRARQCFSTQLKEQGYYDSVRRQAQHLVDRVAQD
jgi:hypothetical protein